MALELDQALFGKLCAAAHSKNRAEWLRTQLVLLGFGMFTKQFKTAEGEYPAVRFRYTAIDGRSREYHSFIESDWLKLSAEECCKYIVTRLVRDASKCLRPIKVGGSGWEMYRRQNESNHTGNKRERVEATNEESVVSVPDEAVTMLVEAERLSDKPSGVSVAVQTGSGDASTFIQLPCGRQIEYDQFMSIRQLQIQLMFERYEKTNKVNKTTFDQLREDVKRVMW
jgi:hypothetical protein